MMSAVASLASQTPVASMSEKMLAEILAKADVCLGGDRPWDIRVNNPALFARLISFGTLGAGESYMDGWWDCDDLAEMTFRIFRNGVFDRLSLNVAGALVALQTRLFNPQTLRRSQRVAKEHYDLGNKLYFSFLDPYHQYSCGYFRQTSDLAVAQQQKMEMICQKLDLRAGQRVLDIGCGWGGLAKYMAEHYRVDVVGITISDEQYQYAKTSCRDLTVQILKQDYRRLGGKFDKIVSVGMFEHVGYKNYRSFMTVAHRLLNDGGLFLLHTIGGNASETSGDAWFEKYIFPNSMLPSVQQIGAATEGLFVMEDWHNFGLDYAKTLQCWYDNFEVSWPTLTSTYDERFRRMWHYYLLSLVGSFRARKTNLWQVVLSKGGVLQPNDFRPLVPR